MRRLGQHSLRDQAALFTIANCLEIKNDDLILEIGSGHGELTDKLIEAAKRIKIVAIEKDRNLVSFLKEKYKDLENVEIIEEDVLKVLPELSDRYPRYKLVGNIPYYITGFLLRKIGELENKPEAIILTLQKEVAERLSAAPPKMNLLAASVQFWGKPEIMRTIGRSAFSPPPKVDSAIIKITPRTENLYMKKLVAYYNLIKVLFKQPRKTILNNLSAGLNKSKEETKKTLKVAGIDGELRPQNLKIEEIILLTALFSGNK